MVLVSAVVVPFQALWGVNPLREAFRVVGGWGVALCVVVPLGIAAHEALHATGWALGGQGFGPVSFGWAPRKLMVYAHYAAPLSLRVYLAGALLPGVAMGVVPAMLALSLGWAPLAGWAALFLGFAAGDLVVAWSLRAVPRGALVRDHPVRAGCTILEGA